MVILMKKWYKIVSTFLAMTLLAGCASIERNTDSESVISSSIELDASVVSSSENYSFHITSQHPASDESSKRNSDIQIESVLQFYDSFRDIPFVEIEYGKYGNDGSINKGSLNKDGEPWCAAPGMMEFGEYCFTDGTKLWIQVYLYPDNGFDWYQVCFDHFHEEESVWIDSANSSSNERLTRDKHFIYAEGYTVYTEDGFSFHVESCPLPEHKNSLLP